MTELRDIVKKLEADTQCTCDLDNWQPEQNTGHSWVCQIHKRAKVRLAARRDAAEVIKKRQAAIHKAVS
jgi:hypothetical protein